LIETHIENRLPWTEGLYTVLLGRLAISLRKQRDTGNNIQQQGYSTLLKERMRVRRGPIDEGCSLERNMLEEKCPSSKPVAFQNNKALL